MKKPIFIANWKMNLGFKETMGLISELKKGLNDFDFSRAEIVVCPSYPVLKSAQESIGELKVSLGAQDCFWDDYGAFTSSVSAEMLKEIGCRYVILGHSERRFYQQETDEIVHKKIKQVLSKKLIPIVCVGESLEERRNLRSDHAVIQQISNIFSGLDLTDQQIILAYEPVWAIGNQAVDSGEAEYMIKVIQHYLYDLLGSDLVKNNFTFVYGGSLNPENVVDFVSRENIDGGLIGGKSLQAESFISMINNSISK
jgi:triosephosphate isomerase